MKFPVLLFLSVIVAGPLAVGADLAGYYRQPSLQGKMIVFQAEGDLWRVPVAGGTAVRLTTHLEPESHPCISPDGRWLAFAASYDGPTEIYRMPIGGGLPERLTFEGTWGGRAPRPVSWKDADVLVYATWFNSRRDTLQLCELDTRDRSKAIIPLEQASDGVFTADGKTLVFTRLPRQRSFAKRYRGGFIENLWRYDEGEEASVPLTGDYEGTSRDAMIWKDRVYFASDRDGTMNLWSMDLSGHDLKQHTRFSGWDVLEPSLDQGRIVFRNQADLWIYRIGRDESRKIPITLTSDFDQTREHWVENPLRRMDSYAISADGKQVAVTVRGHSFIIPVKGGRTIALPHPTGTRTRATVFLPGSDRVYSLSDRSGEFEFWSEPADGSEDARPLTVDATTLRYAGTPSPDGKKIAFTDRDQILHLLELETNTTRVITQSIGNNNFDDLEPVWSPDSRWIAYPDKAPNGIYQVFLYDTGGVGGPIPVTTDRLDSYSPAWDETGNWLYFLSDRTFRSVQGSPWGPRQPEAYLDRTSSIFALDLKGGQHFPFDRKAGREVEEKKDGEEPEKKKDEKPKTEITWDGLKERLYRVPIAAGNYGGLSLARKHLYLVSSSLGLDSRSQLAALAITSDRDEHQLRTIVDDAGSYQLSQDRSTCVVRRRSRIHVFPADGKKPSDLGKTEIDLSGIGFRISPSEEWSQLFTDAWRMHRDYFYDPGMHGVDWEEARKRHEVLLPRITTREELDDLIGQMVGELSAMHTDIIPGDVRMDGGGVARGFLGAKFEKDENGFRILSIYQGDPDILESLSPLAKPGLDIEAGDIITRIDGVPADSASDIGSLLENKSGREVLLEITRPGREETVSELVTPINFDGFISLKLTDWEYTRRLETEKQGKGELGYFHMRAMGGQNFSEFVKGYYPVFNRKGLIIDMRQNYGGNIDSWILARLIRQRWMYWQGRTGESFANMPYAFNGHMAVLIDGYTISDGEAFSEGFRRLGLGPLIGERTWGGGIWLRGNTVLKDGGMARSPETGVFTEDGWVIEGSGVEPDLHIVNEPHATFEGKDAQLEAAVAYLQKMIDEDPPETPATPEHPDKSFDYPGNEEKP